MKKGITAAELMAQLNADPKWVAERAREEAVRQQRAEEWERAEGPLVEELRAAGAKVDSVWDLVNTPGSYPALLPILFDHLWREYPPAVREGIARALAVPESSSGWELLTRRYHVESETRVRSGLAAAIAAAANEEHAADLISLARDPRNGSSRLLLLSALERLSDPRARATLEELEADSTLRKEVRVILRRLDRRRGKRG